MPGQAGAEKLLAPLQVEKLTGIRNRTDCSVWFFCEEIIKISPYPLQKGGKIDTITYYSLRKDVDAMKRWNKAQLWLMRGLIVLLVVTMLASAILPAFPL